MSFKSLQIRYQTARSLPAPYAYFYTLTARPVAGNGLQVDLAITYPDRDDIDDDELIAEGFTRDDDFAWSGKLPKAWLETVANLVSKTRLQPLDEENLDEDDDFWDLTLDMQPAGMKRGTPQNADEWHYTVQELMQAAYESVGRERPFELTYLHLDSRQGEAELRLTASFADRTVTVLTREDRREQSRTLPWPTLQKVMSQVYEHDFDPENTVYKRPNRSGQWLNLGTDEWYDVSRFRALTKKLEGL
jgi:hypothetical protein